MSNKQKNHAVIYQGPNKVTVEEVPYPSWELKVGGQLMNMHHGVILKIVATNICGSDCHMYRGRTSIKPGFQFGHEITGEVFEVGRDVDFLKKGDWVSVPFNVACGRCFQCKKGKTNLCLTANPELKIGGAYGFADMGGWPGGQSEYVMIPWADFNCLKFENRDKAEKKLLDLALLSDILPTGYDGAWKAGVGTGTNVYIAGAGPVGLCAAASSQLLGAANVIVGDYNVDRLQCAKKMGCHVIDLNKTQNMNEAIDRILGEEFVDSAVDCTGYECNGQHGIQHVNPEEKAEALSQCFQAIRSGGMLGVPGVYPMSDPADKDKLGSQGGLKMLYGHAWAKGITIAQGQCPVMQHNRQLMNVILADRFEVAKFINATVISLNEAPQAYQDFSNGAPKKYVIDPHHMLHAHKPVSI